MKTRKHLLLILQTLAVALCVSSFEVLKSVFLPHQTIWQSHALTISFFIIIACLFVAVARKRLISLILSITIDRHIARPLILVVVYVAAGMTIFEFLKTTILPHITIWESHGITILFATLFCALASVTILKKQQAYERELHRELNERKSAEHQLTIEREQLHVTLLSIGDAVITTDSQGKVMMVNRVAEILTGWPLKEAKGKPLREIATIFDHRKKEDIMLSLSRVQETGLTENLEENCVLIDRDGRQRLVADSIAPIRGNDDKTVGAVLTFRDVTERTRMLNELQRVQKLNALGLLAGGIAHDFNNLLHGLYGYIDLLKERSTNGGETEECFDQIHGFIGRARSLAEQLLTFSKGGAPNRKAGSVASLIRKSAEFALSGSAVACEFRIAEHLWYCEHDEGQIGQVIDNIVINAIQSMPNGGTIMISAENISVDRDQHVLLEEGDYIKISIKDSGVGIPSDILFRIFDPFFTTKKDGHGLGLSVCHSIVKSHGGSIEVDTQEGKGSDFQIFLPASSARIEEPAIAAKPTHHGSGSILVMDDEETLRKMMMVMLHTMGYSVVIAQDGAHAIELFSRARASGSAFKAVILDMTIRGGMGGAETIRQIRNLDSTVVAIAISGYTEDQAMSNPSKHGFSRSLKKPFGIRELARLLDEVFPAGV